MNISRFQNPPPLFRGEGCPVIWEWTISDRSARPSTACTIACAQPQLEHETEDAAEQLDNGENSPIRSDVAGAEKSDRQWVRRSLWWVCQCSYVKVDW